LVSGLFSITSNYGRPPGYTRSTLNETRPGY
jgi:hypothetical protein